jgi:aminoglycoside phosphotransferase (APT) family kinase protein
MRRPWEAEYQVPTETVRALFAELCPESADLVPELAGRGWDVDVWRAGDWALRLPRRPLGARTLENEIAVLPWIAPLVAVPVPVPVATRPPGGDYAHACFVHRWLAGDTADGRNLGDDERTALAVPLARLLRGLHALDTTAAITAGAKGDELRRDLSAVRARTLPRLESLGARLGADRLDEARGRIERLPAPASEPDVVIHGDLYARHLVLDGAGALAAVIDWGDACLGDVAVDLDLVYAFLPPSARPAFFAEYGSVSAATRERARYFALARHAVTLLDYALDVGDDPLAREAERALENALG